MLLAGFGKATRSTSIVYGLLDVHPQHLARDLTGVKQQLRWINELRRAPCRDLTSSVSVDKSGPYLSYICSYFAPYVTKALFRWKVVERWSDQWRVWWSQMPLIGTGVLRCDEHVHHASFHVLPTQPSIQSGTFGNLISSSAWKKWK